MGSVIKSHQEIIHLYIEHLLTTPDLLDIFVSKPQCFIVQLVYTCLLLWFNFTTFPNHCEKMGHRNVTSPNHCEEVGHRNAISPNHCEEICDRNVKNPNHCEEMGHRNVISPYHCEELF